MSTATIVSIAALIVSAVAAVGAAISARAAQRTASSAGRHRIAEYSQNWLDMVRDTLSEYLAIVTTEHRHLKDQDEQNKRAAMLVTKLGLLLNPDAKAVQALINALDEIQKHRSDDDALAKHVGIIVEHAHEILKAEWVRIKGELE